jgi:hypothetical protein
VLKELIEIFTDKGDVVIDPCAGSGTTLRAAKELGRNAYGFEIDRTFYNRAKSEMLNFETEQSDFFDELNVKAEQKGGAVLISMSDLKQSSYVFSSGIVKVEKGRLSAAITRKSLEDFYKSADEQTRMTLDLLLAPVFNDEVMSEAEYLEMLASFYGQAAADEVSQSFVKINLISKDASKGASKQTLRYPLSQLLCGNL